MNLHHSAVDGWNDFHNSIYRDIISGTHDIRRLAALHIPHCRPRIGSCCWWGSEWNCWLGLNYWLDPATSVRIVSLVVDSVNRLSSSVESATIAFCFCYWGWFINIIRTDDEVEVKINKFHTQFGSHQSHFGGGKRTRNYRVSCMIIQPQPGKCDEISNRIPINAPWSLNRSSAGWGVILINSTNVRWKWTWLIWPGMCACLVGTGNWLLEDACDTSGGNSIRFMMRFFKLFHATLRTWWEGGGRGWSGSGGNCMVIMWQRVGS